MSRFLRNTKLALLLAASMIIGSISPVYATSLDKKNINESLLSRAQNEAIDDAILPESNDFELEEENNLTEDNTDELVESIEELIEDSNTTISENAENIQEDSLTNTTTVTPNAAYIKYFNWNGTGVVTDKKYKMYWMDENGETKVYPDEVTETGVYIFYDFYGYQGVGDVVSGTEWYLYVDDIRYNGIYVHGRTPLTTYPDTQNYCDAFFTAKSLKDYCPENNYDNTKWHTYSADGSSFVDDFGENHSNEAIYCAYIEEPWEVEWYGANNEKLLHWSSLRSENEDFHRGYYVKAPGNNIIMNKDGSVGYARHYCMPLYNKDQFKALDHTYHEDATYQSKWNIDDNTMWYNKSLLNSQLLSYNATYSNYVNSCDIDKNTDVSNPISPDTLNENPIRWYQYDANYPCHVTYDPNGGTGTPPLDNNTYTQCKNAVVKDQGNLTRQGYIFGGWSENQDGSGIIYRENDKIRIYKNITLYAVWLSSASAEKIKANEANDYLILNGDNRTHGLYFFDVESADVTISTTLEDEDIQAILFDENGNKYNIPSNPSIIKKDKSIFGSIKLPKGKYYLEFIGNLHSSYYQIPLSVNAIYSSLKYDKNGATSGKTPANIIFEKGSSITVSGNNTLAREGYRFIGWKDKNGNIYKQGQVIENVNEDIVLVANWKKTYKVTYHLNGGTGDVPVDENEYITGESATVIWPSEVIKRKGYDFRGWFTKNADNTYTIYKVGIPASITINEHDVILYSDWKEQYNCWGFKNLPQYIRENGTHRIRENDKAILLKSKNLERTDIDNINEQIEKGATGWCYGMASSVGRINKELNSITDYHLGNGITRLRELDKADSAAESIINFYYLQQFLSEPLLFQYKHLLMSQEDCMNELSERATSASPNNPLYIEYFFKNRTSHSVLGIGFRELKTNEEWRKKGYSHCILTYDPSSPPESSNQEDSDFNIYYNDTNGKFFIPIYMNKIDRIYGTNDWSEITPIDYKTGEYNRTTERRPITLTISDGGYQEGGIYYYNEDDDIITYKKDMDTLCELLYAKLPAISESSNGDDSDGFKIFLPDNDKYIVSGDIIDYKLQTNERILCANSTKGGTVTLYTSGKADVVTDDIGDISIKVVDNESSNKLPSHIIIEANNVKHLSENKAGQGLMVSADDFSTIKITTDDNSVTCNPTQNEVFVMENNGKIDVYEDRDQNGTYEQKLKTEEIVTPTQPDSPTPTDPAPEPALPKFNATYSTTLKAGVTVTMKAIAREPEDTNYKIENENPNIASITNDGTIKTLSPGLATAYVTKKNAVYRLLITVTENLDPPKDTPIEKGDALIVVGGKINMPELAKEATDGKDYKITIADKSKISFSNKGVLQGKKVGSTTLTVAKANKTTTLTVVVIAPKYDSKSYIKNTGDIFDTGFNAQGLEVIYTSSKPAVAEIDNKGNIKALSKGSTSISAKVQGKTYKVTVRVYDPILTGENVLLTNKKSKTLKIKNGYGKTTWESSDSSVVTVKNGKITGISKGTAVITAVNNNRMMSQTVTVYNTPKFDKKVYVTNADIPITVALTKDDDMKGVEYLVSNINIATIDDNGKVTPIKKGNVSVTGKVAGIKYKTTLKIFDPYISGKTEVKTNKSITLSVKSGYGVTKWESSNPSVATVNEKGKVTGISTGTATIKAVNNGRTMTQTINVVSQ